MIHLTESTKILLATKPVDFRRQIDGLVSLCHKNLKQDPLSGSLFVFINRSKTMIRILCYGANGYWLATKRLSRGHYSQWPNSSESLHSAEAKYLKILLKEALASTQYGE